MEHSFGELEVVPRLAGKAAESFRGLGKGEAGVVEVVKAAEEETRRGRSWRETCRRLHLNQIRTQ
jgi:hypothetical protein